MSFQEQYFQFLRLNMNTALFQQATVLMGMSTLSAGLVDFFQSVGESTRLDIHSQECKNLKQKIKDDISQDMSNMREQMRVVMFGAMQSAFLRLTQEEVAILEQDMILSSLFNDIENMKPLEGFPDFRSELSPAEFEIILDFLTEDVILIQNNQVHPQHDNIGNYVKSIEGILEKFNNDIEQSGSVETKKVFDVLQVYTQEEVLAVQSK